MPGGVPDRIAEGGVPAAPHRGPCCDAKLRPRLMTDTNGARLADNVPSARIRRRLRPASPQRCFPRSPPRAVHHRREPPVGAREQPRGRRWCAALRLLQTKVFRGLGKVAVCAADIDPGRATGSVAKARTRVAMAWSTSASPAMVATPGGVIPIVMFLFGRGVLGLQSGRSLLEPVVRQIPLCRRSGGCLGGNRLDPSHDVRLP